jgi:hypothetical protein
MPLRGQAYARLKRSIATVCVKSIAPLLQDLARPLPRTCGNLRNRLGSSGMGQQQPRDRIEFGRSARRMPPRWKITSGLITGPPRAAFRSLSGSACSAEAAKGGMAGLGSEGDLLLVRVGF